MTEVIHKTNQLAYGFHNIATPKNEDKGSMNPFHIGKSFN
jgi:hypothetical protein